MREIIACSEVEMIWWRMGMCGAEVKTACCSVLQKQEGVESSVEEEDLANW